LRLQLWEAYCEVRSLCSHLRGNDITDSALSTDSSMDESSETSSAKDVPTGSLHTSLLELRRLTQNLLDGNESTGSRRSDEEALEEQVRKLGEELREVRELYEAEQDKTRSNEEELLQLHNQMALLSVEICSLRDENKRVRMMAEVREPSEQLQSAIRDRDDAIAKALYCLALVVSDLVALSFRAPPLSPCGAPPALERVSEAQRSVLQAKSHIFDPGRETFSLSRTEPCWTGRAQRTDRHRPDGEDKESDAAAKVTTAKRRAVAAL
ncbi:BICD family-like cargo adapter 1 isoform X1, partial [Lates japonicus]